MDPGIPPLETKNMLESDPLKSRFSVCEQTELPSFKIYTLQTEIPELPSVCPKVGYLNYL